MAIVHVSEAEAVRDFAALLAKVRGGADIVIDGSSYLVAVQRESSAPRRMIEECVSLLPENSSAVIDEEFARDVKEAVASHSEPLTSPAWD